MTVTTNLCQQVEPLSGTQSTNDLSWPVDELSNHKADVSRKRTETLDTKEFNNIGKVYVIFLFEVLLPDDIFLLLSDHLWVLIPDVLMVLFTEFLVDWVKHAFITKFNEIPFEVYREYTVSIAYDLAASRHKNASGT